MICSGRSRSASGFAGFLDRHDLRRTGQAQRRWPAARGAGPAADAARACAGRTGWSGCSARLFDESEFLSPYGLRALSAYHRDHPYTLEYDGIKASIDYEPAESTTPMFGGNSNWRGPIWFPLNYL